MTEWKADRPPALSLYPRKPQDRRKGRTQSAKEGGTWADFVETVAEAARKRARRARGKTGKRLPKSGDPTGLWPASLTCDFLRGAEGIRCKNWPMKGATRCRHHGGYRQNPAHPATVALYQSGEITKADQRKRARAELATGGYPELIQIRDAIKARTGGSRVPSHVLLEGIKTAREDDGGMAWRRFLHSLPILRQRDTRESEAPAERSGET
jgi:hypothetical protein